MIELQSSKSSLEQTTAITNFLSGFVAKVRNSVSSFFCVKPSEKMNCESTESDAIYEIQNQIIQFTVTAKQPQKPQKQFKISVRRGELAGAKCVGNKIATMIAIIRKNLTSDQFRFFRKQCLQRYDLAYDKSCIFIYFLFLRVMLESKQINHDTFSRVYKLLQKSLKRSISWYEAGDQGPKSRRKIINSIILGEYLKLSYIPIKGGEYEIVAKVFSSFFVNKTSLGNCLDKIERVIHHYLCLTDLFDDLN